MESLLESIWPSSPQNRGEPQCPGAPWQQTALPAPPRGCTLETGFPRNRGGFGDTPDPLTTKGTVPMGPQTAAIKGNLAPEKKKREPIGVALAVWGALQPGVRWELAAVPREPSQLLETAEVTVHRLSFFTKVGG